MNYIGKRVRVIANYDFSTEKIGTIIQDDDATIVKMDDGRVLNMGILDEQGNKYQFQIIWENKNVS